MTDSVEKVRQRSRPFFQRHWCDFSTRTRRTSSGGVDRSKWNCEAINGRFQMSMRFELICAAPRLGTFSTISTRSRYYGSVDPSSLRAGGAAPISRPQASRSLRIFCFLASCAHRRSRSRGCLNGAAFRLDWKTQAASQAVALEI